MAGKKKTDDEKSKDQNEKGRQDVMDDLAKDSAPDSSPSPAPSASSVPVSTPSPTPSPTPIPQGTSDFFRQLFNSSPTQTAQPLQHADYGPPAPGQMSPEQLQLLKAEAIKNAVSGTPPIQTIPPSVVPAQAVVSAAPANGQILRGASQSSPEQMQAQMLALQKLRQSGMTG